MKGEEYTCAMCGGLYEKGWSDEEADRESMAYFGITKEHEDATVVCDDCFNKIHPALNPEKVAQARNELKT